MAIFANKAYCLDKKYHFTDAIQAFRGQSKFDKRNWDKRKNQLKRYSGGQRSKVDALFYQDLNKAKEQTNFFEYFFQVLNEHPFADVIMTGHNVGAVYAILTALELKKNLAYKNRKFIVYSFGQPRFGNRNFSFYINKQIILYRITRVKDIVTQIPVLDEYGYWHPQTEFWIEKDETSEENNNCECNNDFLLVWECKGKKRIGYIDENEECSIGQNNIDISQDNIDKTDNELFSNRGPYFGVVMGEC
ncbi:hypothetical protein G9A89_007707 [Geosiphon pyriformis]|nr:hypothetical protein G9A89_007707 [Geosiphon pyriformis]